jgi:hypothetical protein
VDAVDVLLPVQFNKEVNIVGLYVKAKIDVWG